MLGYTAHTIYKIFSHYINYLKALISQVTVRVENFDYSGELSLRWVAVTNIFTKLWEQAGLKLYITYGQSEILVDNLKI